MRRGPRRASRTAESVAALRAIGSREPHERLRNPDGLAARLIPVAPRLAALAKLPLPARLGSTVSDLVAPGAYAYETARTKHVDAVLRDELAGGVRQVVLLGAGYDSRPYRLADLLLEARVFELDLPALSELKQRRVRRALGRPPANVAYVAVDLERRSWRDALTGTGFDADAAAVLVWIGVSMYLPPAAVRSTLASVAERAVPGSSIVFDYILSSVVRGADEFPEAAKFRRYGARRGEPFRFGIDAGGTESFLAELGLDLADDLDADELRKRYLAPAGEPLPCRPPPPWDRIALARVPTT